MPMDTSFGFNKDDTVLCSIIDKAQKYVDTDAIELSWTGRVFDYSKKITEQRARYLAIFGVVISIILIATAFFFVRTVILSNRLKKVANTDSLTGIYNRRFFMEMCSLQTQQSMRTGTYCFIILFDLDHFKVVNDQYGHQAGDKVLKEVAQRVKGVIRPYDVMGRYGGEEFIILMAGKNDVTSENISNAAERCRTAICDTPVMFDNKEINISASFGIAFAAPKTDTETAIKQADEALYRAKEEGRNRVVFFEGGDGT